MWILIALISATAIKIIHSHFIKYSFRLIFLLVLTLESCFSLWGSQNATHVRWEFCIQSKRNIISWIIVTPAILIITENGNWISFVWNPPLAKEFSCYCLFCFICVLILPHSWSYFHFLQYLVSWYYKHIGDGWLEYILLFWSLLQRQYPGTTGFSHVWLKLYWVLLVYEVTFSWVEAL